MSCSNLWARLWQRSPLRRLIPAKQAMTGGGGGGGGGFFNTAPAHPVISTTSPSPDSGAVPLSATISVTFNRAVRAVTLSPTCMTVRTAAGTYLAGEVTSYGAVVSFTPTAPLAADTKYIVVVTTDILDIFNLPLSQSYTWSFNTASLPTVVSTVPAAAASIATPTDDMSILFSKAMAPTSINATSVRIVGTSVGATALVSISNIVASNSDRTYTFTPSAPFANGSYKIVINDVATGGASGGVKDTFGNSLVAPENVAFTVAATVPDMTTSVPADNATGVAVGSTIVTNWNKPMNLASFTSASFQVKQTVGSVITTIAGAFTKNAAGDLITFTPAGNFTSGASVVVTISTAVQDTFGNKIAAETFDFTVA
jgi:hypothetical protein